MENNSFAQRPIIILGVNHSGTRVLVDILNILGSDGGDCNNTWRENKLFLTIHEELMDACDAAEWTKKIFDLNHIKQLNLDDAKKKAIQIKINAGVAQAYPAYTSRPWHWKCPTSALFLDFWMETYPEAYFVHIVRDPLDVAQSLISRRQFYTIKSAQKFCDLMEKQLSKAFSAKHYLKINYENLSNEVPNLIEFMPFLNADNITQAKTLIRKSCVKWRSNRTIKHNLWNLSAAMRVQLAKSLR